MAVSCGVFGNVYVCYLCGCWVSVLRMIWFGVVIWFRLDLDLTLGWVFGFGFRSVLFCVLG